MIAFDISQTRRLKAQGIAIRYIIQPT